MGSVLDLKTKTKRRARGRATIEGGSGEQIK